MQVAAPRARTTRTLEDWLHYIEQVSAKPVDMGLERTRRVKAALGLEPRFPVITVGGTNGKGSTCAMLEAILAQAGYRVGRYTSPHLVRPNERVCIDGVEAADAELCGALARVEQARGETPLTYFEFGTLAAMLLFHEARVDVAILEVGLGGRLDAVNVFDADCAVITSVDLDHMDYLGDTREAIAFEKAGIFRPGRPAVCGEPDVPHTMVRHAGEIGAGFRRIGEDFGYGVDGRGWCWWDGDTVFRGLPFPALQGRFQLQNASACLAALKAVEDRLPVSVADIRAGLPAARLPGRFQVFPGAPTVILDVAHNPHAAAALATNLAAAPCAGRTLAVFAMLHDKDIAGVVRAVKDQVHRWLVAGTAGPRGAGAGELAGIVAAVTGEGPGATFATPLDAFLAALAQASPGDRVVVFGSFHTVAPVLAELEAVAEYSPA